MMPQTARALLLLPAGLRAFETDVSVPFPLPREVDLRAVGGGCFKLMHIHHAGEVDGETRALYILGGVHLPIGAQLTADPDEAHDQ